MVCRRPYEAAAERNIIVVHEMLKLRNDGGGEEKKQLSRCTQDTRLEEGRKEGAKASERASAQGNIRPGKTGFLSSLVETSRGEPAVSTSFEASNLEKGETVSTRVKCRTFAFVVRRANFPHLATQREANGILAIMAPKKTWVATLFLSFVAAASAKSAFGRSGAKEER